MPTATTICRAVIAGFAPAFLAIMLARSAACAVEPSPVPDLVLVRVSSPAAPGDGLWIRRAQGALNKVVDADGGTIADPAVDALGRNVAFAWRRRAGSTYRLALVDLATLQVTAITPVNEALGDDRSPAWLADGSLVFRSTRMGQAAADGHHLAGALYLIAPTGRFLRRVTWDQDIIGAPQVLDDGRILYLRTDGVGQATYPVAMTMHADGTNQKPWYSWQGAQAVHPDHLFSTEAAEERVYAGITDPGHGSVAAADTGNAVLREVWTINRLAGRQFPAGATSVSGMQAGGVDPRAVPGFGWIALTEPGTGQSLLYGKQFGTWQGRIELPAPEVGNPGVWRQPEVVQSRTWYGSFPSVVDHRQQTGFLYIQDIGVGEGLPAAVRKQATQVRIIALQWPLAGAEQTSPTASIVGTVPLEADGSLFVQVPAATPLMLQALDATGATIGRMRSWLALQPGERLSCIGCHSDERRAPPMGRAVAAFLREPRTLTAPGLQSLAFTTSIAPLLKQECGSCHVAAAPVAGRAILGAAPSDLYAWLSTSGWLLEKDDRRSLLVQVIGGASIASHPPLHLNPDMREVLSAWCDLGAPPPQPGVSSIILTRAAAWGRVEGLAIRDFNLHRFGKIEQ